MSFKPTELEYELLDKINQIRQHPESLIPILEERIPQFREEVFWLSKNKDLGQNTLEGAAGYREAIRFLKAQKSLKPLKYAFGLSKSSILHAVDMSSSGLEDHIGSDGSNLQARIQHYGIWGGEIAENLKFGFKDALGILIELIVDDGVFERNNRNCVFNENFEFLGLAYRNHPKWGCCTVIVYAEEYLSNFD